MIYATQRHFRSQRSSGEVDARLDADLRTAVRGKESGVKYQDVTWSVATKITCPDKTVAKREFWQQTFGELFAANWDLLLCSAGSLSAVICEAARQRGRRAIDVGAVDQQFCATVATMRK